MKRLLITTACLLLTASAIRAQVTPDVLSDRQAFVRILPAKTFLLLPVQEKEENAHVRVVCDNQVVKTFNVRLAVDKVDYYVPLRLTGLTSGDSPLLLDIALHGDKRTTGAISDFACWREMRQSDTFDTANREAYRPAYHHTPAYGWMNDPNGMVYKDGVWHLYFQYNPYGSQWENMTWGHSTSTDLVHWTQQPDALEPDALGAIFSGSAVTDRNNTAGFGAGALVAMYTSAGTMQTQSLAYSLDGGTTFTKYNGNPVITQPTPDFRDPKVIWHEPTQRWIVVLAAGQEVMFYSSANLREWRYESSFGRTYGNHGGVWECPDLLNMGDGNWVLLLNINPGGPFGGSATQYFTGSFDGHQFTCSSRPQTTKWMDYGKDHYATVTFADAPEGRHVALAWMSNWQYANQVPTTQFRSANSIPRDLSLFTDGDETYLASRPSPEMDAARGARQKRLSDACEIVVSTGSHTEIELSNARGEKTVMVYDAADRSFQMDRTKSGNSAFSEAFAAVTTAPTHGAVRQLRIFIDRCSIEAFDAEGKMAMTNLVFPTEPYTTLKVKGGKATIYKIEN